MEYVTNGRPRPLLDGWHLVEIKNFEARHDGSRPEQAHLNVTVLASTNPDQADQAFAAWAWVRRRAGRPGQGFDQQSYREFCQGFVRSMIGDWHSRPDMYFWSVAKSSRRWNDLRGVLVAVEVERAGTLNKTRWQRWRQSEANRAARAWLIDAAEIPGTPRPSSSAFQLVVDHVAEHPAPEPGCARCYGDWETKVYERVELDRILRPAIALPKVL